MRIRSFVRLAQILTFASFTGFAPLASHAAEFAFKLHHFLGEKSLAHTKMLMPWAKRIEEASGTRIKITIHADMSLGGEPQQLAQQVRDGVVDMAWFTNAYAGERFLRAEVFELPGVHRGNSAAVNLAMRSLYSKYLKADYDGLIPLFLHTAAPNAVHMVKDEARSPREFRNKKIRVMTRVDGWVAQALSATPVPAISADTSVAPSDAAVDGSLIPFGAIAPFKSRETMQVRIEGPDGARFGAHVFQLAFNLERWEALPADIRKIFRDASGASWHREIGGLWDRAETDARAAATKAGKTHVRLTGEQWTKIDGATKTVTTRWIKNLKTKGIENGQAIYDKAVALVGVHMPRD